jgi:murein DD-endopeptidase MepM/ murein hydrolase activator NlpD
MIVIDHGGGISTVYMHNYRNDVQTGDYVEQGQQIGIVGQTGPRAGSNRLSEAHLHFEVRINGTLVDPASYLNSPCP